MPCDTLNTVKVELRVANLELLAQAITDLGGSVVRTDKGLNGSLRGVYYTYADNELNLQTRGTETRSWINEVKRSYSLRVVQHTARRNGWKVNFKQGSKNTQMVVTKGGW